jgi:Ca2+-binding RTX toxin-like protein
LLPQRRDSHTTSSADQTLTGTGGNDTFVFAPGFGHDTITNFQPTTDVLQIEHSAFANVQALLAATQDDGHGNVVITIDLHDTITLQHVTLTPLQAHQGDFHII